MKAKMDFGNIVIEAEGDAKEVFTDLAKASEVFGQSTCGACNSANVTPVVREVDGNTYYEMRCNQCYHRLAFGQRRQDGALFPRRKDKEGNWLDNNGWTDPRKARAVESAERDRIPF